MEERNLVEVEVAGKKCDIWQHGSGGPVILWGMYPHEGNELVHMQECLEEMCPDQNFLLADRGICAISQGALWSRQAAVPDRIFPGRAVRSMSGIPVRSVFRDCVLFRFPVV